MTPKKLPNSKSGQHSNEINIDDVCSIQFFIDVMSAVKVARRVHINWAVNASVDRHYSLISQFLSTLDSTNPEREKKQGISQKKLESKWSCFICGNAWMLSCICDVICIATMRPSFNFDWKFCARFYFYTFATSIPSRRESISFCVLYIIFLSLFFCRPSFSSLVGNRHDDNKFNVQTVFVWCHKNTFDLGWHTLWMNYMLNHTAEVWTRKKWLGFFLFTSVFVLCLLVCWLQSNSTLSHARAVGSFRFFFNYSSSPIIINWDRVLVRVREKSARCIITSWKDILQLRWTLDNSIFELIPLNTNDQHSHHKQNKLDERVHNWQVTQRKTRASESGDEGGGGECEWEWTNQHDHFTFGYSKCLRWYRNVCGLVHKSIWCRYVLFMSLACWKYSV